MQTRTSSIPVHGVRAWRLTRLIAAGCAMVALAGASAASAAAPTAAAASAPAPTYQVIPLAPNGSQVNINAQGQVAFTGYEGDIPRARFYDGRVVRDLGTFGGSSAVVYALNDLGQVAGTASTDGGPFHAFRWSRQTGLVDLNAPGVGNSIAIDINNKGQVVGVARFPGTPERAFRWSPQTGMVNLGALGPTSSSLAYAINDPGTAVGWSDEASGPRLTQITKWPPGGGGPIPLNDFPSIASLANDINNAGQIVGIGAFDARGNDQAFFWTRQGGLQGLGTESLYRSEARRINEQGLVIGTLSGTPGNSNGFIWSRENGLLVVGTLDVERSDVTDVNNRGQVVGYVENRAFVWTRAGGFVDLNSLISNAPPGAGPFFPVAISDNGTIVAGGTAGLYLLVPNARHQQPPVTGPVKFTGQARVGALLSFSASFRDVDVRETHKAVWSWGDGSRTVGTVSERNGSGSVSGQHVYRAAGIYTVRLTITDSGGKSSTVERKVVVCGTQNAIAGEGMFVSLALAKTGARRTSLGHFAYLAEAGPARKAAVEANVAGMALRSTKVDAVTVGDTYVQYSGAGTVNGSGNYRFTLRASSGAKTDGKDRIHLRIAHTEPGTQNEVVDYDNGAGSGAGTATADIKGGAVIVSGRMGFGIDQER